VRAREIDSAVAVNAQRHLADLAFMERDADAHAHFATAAIGPRGPALLGYQGAVIRGNLASIREARSQYARAWARNEEEGPGWAFRGLTIPHTELDSLISELEVLAPTQALRDSVAEWKRQAAYMEGRPGAGGRLSFAFVQRDSISEYAAALERAEDDSLAAERLDRAAESRIHPYRCEVALSRLRRRDTTGVAGILASQPRLDDRRPASEVMSVVGRGLNGQAKLCGQILRAAFASTSPGESKLALALLWRADSMMKVTTVNYGTLWNYDLTLAFARRGDYAAAAAAVRRRFVDASNLPRRLVLALRQEGRWAAQAGDIASAIEAYEHYLLWRGDPEPALVPQRDSVLAELAGISRARR